MLRHRFRNVRSRAENPNTYAASRYEMPVIENSSTKEAPPRLTVDQETALETFESAVYPQDMCGASNRYVYNRFPHERIKLLRKCHWNAEQAIAQYYDRQDKLVEERLVKERPAKERPVKDHHCEVQTYEYQPLKEDSIRLIRLLPLDSDDRLSCELIHQHAYFEDQTSYTALSYCWGNVQKTEDILVNGHNLPITNNLWQALNAIRDHHCQPENDLFWIDAICINQQDTLERDAQVQQMWRVFASAKQTFAWLGTNYEHSIDILRDGPALYELYRNNPSVIDKEMSQYASDLMNNEYFSRAWIKQEFAQSKDLHFLSGELSIGRSTLSSFCDLPKLRLSGFSALYETTGDVDFYRLLYSFATSRCNDARDRIFAMLGHPIMRKLDPEATLRADYSLERPELLLVVMEWYVKFVLKQHKSHEAPRSLTAFFGLARSALGLDNNHTNLLELLEAFFDVRIDEIPKTLVLASGREIDCSDAVWHESGKLLQRRPARELSDTGASISYSDYASGSGKGEVLLNFDSDDEW